jgi:acyl-CoA synthetase (AMP-forming)/AMP-acid ligase II
VVKQRFTSSDWPPPPGEPTLVDLLRRRAAEHADRQIYHLLGDDFFDTGIHTGPSLSYGQLDEQSRAIAVALRKLARPGDRVLLLFAPSLEFMPAFFGCLYAGMIPVPTHLPTRGFELAPLDGLRRIAGNCQPTTVLTGGEIAADVRELCRPDPLLAPLSWVVTDSVDLTTSDYWQRPDIDAQTPALLQYTSGSTGSPRGVLVTHDNILKNEYIIQLALNHMTHLRPGVGICWLPFYHDMGLMGSVIQSVFVDGPCYFLSPLQFLRKPVRWLQAITHLAPETAYISGGPNFAFELCARKVTEEQKATLDLSHWEVACIGAEPISAGTIRRFSDAFAGCGFDPDAFYPGYGLAEATLFVTGGDYFQPPTIRRFTESDGRMVVANDGEQTRELVGCGRAWQDHQVLIVDPETGRECAPGTIGEIWVHGPCVASGYWDEPEQTDTTFHAMLPGDDRHFLRTGDLGFFDDGELFVSGRLKDMIVIRGRNHSPDDIEATVRGLHDAFRPVSTAALGVVIDDEERLVILQEIDRQSRAIRPRQLAAEVRRRIAEVHRLHVHEIVFLRNGALPRTTSGKLRRSACREMYQAGTLRLWKGVQPDG